MQQPQMGASQDDRTLAMLTHLSGILFSFIVPLIVWLTQKDTKPWVADEAKEALNFQITLIFAAIVAIVLTITVILSFIGIPLFFAIAIVNVIFCIIAGIKANAGESYRYPLTIRLIT